MALTFVIFFVIVLILLEIISIQTNPLHCVILFGMQALSFDVLPESFTLTVSELGVAQMLLGVSMIYTLYKTMMIRSRKSECLYCEEGN